MRAHGRVLKDVKEIIDYIDAYMKPESLIDHENPEETWLNLLHI